MNINYSELLTAGNGTNKRPTQLLIKGDGTRNCPYYFPHARFAGETTRIKDCLLFAKNNGVKVVNIAYSGVPYILESDGKWHRRAQTIAPAAQEIENSTAPILV